MQVDNFVTHHFSAKCLPRFAIAFPSGVFICTDEPSIQKHHRSQEHSTLPSLHSTMHLSFPSLFLALSAISFENFGLLKRVLSHSFPIFYRIQPSFTLLFLKNSFSLPSIHFRHRAHQYAAPPSIRCVIQVSFPFLPTALSVCIISKYLPISSFQIPTNRRFRIRKNKKKRK